MNTYKKMSKPQKDYYPDAATRELFVGNLSKGAEVIFKVLDGFTYFQPDREGRPYGFIGFKSAEQCNAALEELTGKVFNRRIIEVRRPNSYVPPKITKQKKRIQQKLATEKWEKEESVLVDYEKTQKEYIEQSEALKYFEEQKQQEKDRKILELQQQLEYYQKRDQEIIAQQQRDLEQKRLIEQQLLQREQQRLIEQQRIIEQQQRFEQQRLIEQQQLLERQQQEAWQKWVENEKLQAELKIQQEKIEKERLTEQLHKFNFEVVSAEQYSLIQGIHSGPETESEKNVYFGLKEMKSISGLQPGSTAEILYNALYYKYRHYNLLGI